MPQQYSTLVLIVLMVVAFYFLILRPQKKRQQALQKTMRALEPGSRVVLGSGLFGTIVSIGEKQAVLEISPGTQLTVLKQAIVRTVTDADEDASEVEDDLADGYTTGAVTETDYSRLGEPTSYTERAPEPFAPATDEAATGTTSGSETEQNRLR